MPDSLWRVASNRRAPRGIAHRGELLTPENLAWSILAGVRDHRLRCCVCEDVIGFYEPIVVIENSEFRRTSLLNEPMLDAEQAVMHHRCARNADAAPPAR
jgi:hypothetical protein